MSRVPEDRKPRGQWIETVNNWWANLDKRWQVVLIIGVFCLLAVAYSVVGSKGSYTINVAGTAFGDFSATTTNTGDTSDSPDCRVTAYDAFGNRIGSDSFDLKTLEPAEVYTWRGQVRVNEPVARYEGECD